MIILVIDIYRISGAALPLPTACAYYQQQAEKGKPHNTIIRSLAFKWIRIIFRCWKENKPYDESRYLEALRKRGSPLLQYAVKS
jgi:hypothetical protein